MIELPTILRLTSALVGVHAVLISLQQFSSWRKFEESGILSWDVSKLFINSSALAPVVVPILHGSRFKVVLATQGLMGILVASTAIAGYVLWPLHVVLLLTYVGIFFRQPVGLTGDLDMAVIVLTGTVVAAAAPADSMLEQAGVLFIAAQALLAYLIAGVTKAISADWRSGDAIAGIFSTQTWGNQYVYSLVTSRPRLKLVGSWAVIAFESLFVAVLFVDAQVALLILFGGVVFHFCNAVFMGLNGFLLSFAASYPSVYYANHIVSQLL